MSIRNQLLAFAFVAAIAPAAFPAQGPVQVVDNGDMPTLGAACPANFPPAFMSRTTGQIVSCVSQVWVEIVDSGSCQVRGEYYCGCDWDADGDNDADDIDTCFDTAVASLGNAEDGSVDGAAWVVLPDGTFNMGTHMPWTIPNGLHIRGVPARFEIVGNCSVTTGTDCVLDADCPVTETCDTAGSANHVRKHLTGGSVLDCGAGICMTGREWQGNVFRDFALTDFTIGIQAGGDGIMSGHEVRMENLNLIGDPDRAGTCTDGLHIYNPLHWYMESIAVGQCARGLLFTCQSDGQPGNSVITDFDFNANDASFAEVYENTQGGIKIETITPSVGTQLGCNYFTFIRPQVWASADGGCEADNSTPDAGAGTGTKDFCDGSSKIHLSGSGTMPITFTTIVAADLEGTTAHPLLCEKCVGGSFDIRSGSNTSGGTEGTIKFDSASIENIITNNYTSVGIDNNSITNLFFGQFNTVSTQGVRTSQGVYYTKNYIDGGGNNGTMFVGDRVILGDAFVQHGIFHDGATLRATAAESTTTVSGTVDLMTIGYQAKPPFLPTRWYSPRIGVSDGLAANTHEITPTANSIYLMPWYIPEATTFDQIGIYATTADAGQNLRLCLYELDWTTGLCDTLLYESGDISVGTTGIKSVTGLSVTVDSARWTCVGFITDATTAVFHAIPSADFPVNMGTQSFFENETYGYFKDAVGSLDCPDVGTSSSLDLVGSFTDTDGDLFPHVQLRTAP